jgi:hypothetical protein
VPLLTHPQSSFGSKAILQGGSLFRRQTREGSARLLKIVEGAGLLLRLIPAAA